MELYFVVSAVLGCGIVLVLALLGYLMLYKAHINKALRNTAEPIKRWISPVALLVLIPVVLLVCTITISILEVQFDISNSRLTSREEILDCYTWMYEENWDQNNMVMTMTDEFALVLHYLDDYSDSQFDIYRNDPNGPTNYVGRKRMSLTAVERGVMMVECDGAMLFGSLNQIRVAKIVTDDGVVYEIDPDEPFVLVIPDGCSRLVEKLDGPISTRVYGYSGFTAYDEYGKEMDLLSFEWWELQSMP